MDEGIGSGSNGMLDVGGNLVLGGTLDIDLLNSFAPTNGQVFDLINYNGLESGQFAGITGSDASEWTIDYNQGQVDLEFNKPVTNLARSGLRCDAYAPGGGPGRSGIRRGQAPGRARAALSFSADRRPGVSSGRPPALTRRSARVRKSCFRRREGPHGPRAAVRGVASHRWSPGPTGRSGAMSWAVAAVGLRSPEAARGTSAVLRQTRKGVLDGGPTLARFKA